MQKTDSIQSGGRKPSRITRGVAFYDEFLAADAQRDVVAALRDVARAAPMFSPDTPYGKPMSVRLTAAGQFGWYSDRTGYRYVPQHPNGFAWPDIPETILDVWRAVAPDAPQPECCLVNYYREGAKMGLHQDRDEADFRWPVVSISLGDDALFRIGNVTKGGSTVSEWLRSGDVCVMGGDARLVYHGIDRIKFGTSPLLTQGGRINLTLRVVT
ncbi:MAG: alpha-ketoglutarate-dependent dioxygenase AlkB family protein [Planktomarina sp.]